MSIIERFKAEIITFLLTGIFVLGLFSIHLKQHRTLITESYYEIEPEPETPEEEIIPNKLEDAQEPSSDKAFNEDAAYKELMRNFKTVSADDFEQTTKALEDAKTNTTEEDLSEINPFSNNVGRGLSSKETEAYKKLQEQLKKRQKTENTIDEHSKGRSSLTYSLKNRVLESYQTPRYLCEYGGTIVVSIKVDAMGNVIEAYNNGASSSNNQCLEESAIAYAKTAQFNSSERQNQIGTITFIFKGKN